MGQLKTKKPGKPSFTTIKTPYVEGLAALTHGKWARERRQESPVKPTSKLSENWRGEQNGQPGVRTQTSFAPKKI